MMARAGVGAGGTTPPPRITLSRLVLAGVCLAVLGGLVVMIARGGGESLSVRPGRREWAIWSLLAPLSLTALGLVRRSVWGRWSGLAIGIAVVPWAFALTFGPTYGQPVTRQAVAFTAAVLLFLALLGKPMFAEFEGRTGNMDWTGRLMGLVRWTIICNLASALSLYLFVTIYDYRVGWLAVIPALILSGLIGGVLLLAHQKTVGLLLVALSCVLFVPAGTYFVWREARDPLEALLFFVVFGPGIATGWASLVAFGRPVWQYLRAE